MSFAVSLDKRGEHMRALDAKKKRYQKDKEKHDKVYDDILSTPNLASSQVYQMPNRNSQKIIICHK